MAEGMDTGDMIAKAETEIGGKTADELFEELSVLGARLLVEYVPLIENGSAPREKQDDSQATLAPMVNKEDIDWTKSAREISCLIGGTECRTLYKDQFMKIQYAVESDGSGQPGTVIRCDKHNVEVACGSGSLLLKKVQLPGKKSMDISSFLLGNKIEEGTILG